MERVPVSWYFCGKGEHVVMCGAKGTCGYVWGKENREHVVHMLEIP